MKRFILTAAMALGVSLLPVAAFAGPITLSLGTSTSSGGNVTPLSFTTNLDGSVQFTGTASGWTLSVVGGTTSYPGNPYLDLSVNKATCSSGCSDLYLWLTGSGFTGPANFIGSITSHASTGALTMTGFYGPDPQNVPDTWNTVGSVTVGPSGSTVVGSFYGVGPGPGGYTAGVQDTFTVDANGAGTYTSTDSSLSTPEPASLALLGTGLLGLGLFGFKRKAFSFGPQA